MNLFSPLKEAARLFPEKLAIDGATQISYSALEKSAGQLASFLRSNAVTPKTLVILDIPESLSIAFEWACWQLGAIPCDYVKSADYSFTENKILITTEQKSSMKAIQIDRATLASISDSEPLNETSYEYAPNDIAQVLMSSGTTGKPKPIPVLAADLHQRANLGESAWARKKPAMCTMTKGTVAWSNYKIFSVNNADTILIAGGEASVFELANRYRIRSIMTSPITLRALIDFVESNDKKLSHLEEIYVGGGVTPEKLAQKASRHAKVFNIYGSTEAGSISCAEFTEGSKSVGKAFDDVEFEVVDSKHRSVADGKEGILRYKRPTMANRYLSDDEGFVNDWFYPGDLAKKNTAGEIEIVGRVSESVSVGGLKVNLAELDAKFQQIEELADLASFSFINNEETQIGVAVVAGEGFDPQTVSNKLFQLSDRPKISSVFLVEEITRNQNGKVQREKLADLFTSKLFEKK